MKFNRTNLNGAWRIDLEPAFDNRGYFARTFSEDAFAAHGLQIRYPQHSISYNAKRGTLRGMHFQREPHAEVKLVRCLSGAIWDVIIDITPGSPTFRRWQGFELSAATGQQLYIPKGFAHGFQTLTDDAVVGYLISAPYMPQSARGIRHDDTDLGIAWPLAITEISDKDRRLDTLEDALSEAG